MRKTSLSETYAVIHGLPLAYRTRGLKSTIIDFTFSRLLAPDGKVVFYDLDNDPELFDAAYGMREVEIRRRMREISKSNWAGKFTDTNCIWMQYLVDVMLHLKRIPLTWSNRSQLREFQTRTLTYDCCGQLLWDSFFSDVWVV